MKTILGLLLMLVVIALGCQSAKKDNKISIGKIDSVYSGILKEQRRIMVYVPNEGEHGDFSPIKYPVLYLLDGDSHFHAVSGLVQQLSVNGLIPEMIVVAIPNTDRSRDLTPSRSEKMPDGGSRDFLKTTGGGENFTSFIEKELMPYVESHYPTAPYRMLIGHSFGGIFAINCVVNHPQLFNSLVSIDPSMWWDDSKLLHHSDSVWDSLPLKNRSLFLSIANTMNAGMDTSRVMSDTSSNSSHIRSILKLAKMAHARKSNGLKFGWKYYDQDDHGSVPLISEYDAFRFIFDFYKPKQDFLSLTPEILADHFRMLSDRMGYNLLPPEPFVNGLGGYYLEEKKLDKAEAFYQLNLKNYPNSPSVYEGLGDFYLTKGDTLKGVENYKKALSIKEMSSTRKKLEGIR